MVTALRNIFFRPVSFKKQSFCLLNLNTFQETFHKSFSTYKKTSLNGGDRERICIRSLNQSERQQVNDWAKNEGWNQSQKFLTSDNTLSHVHMALFYNDTLAASMSVTRYSNSTGKTFSFLGNFIAKPCFRKQGLGEILARAVLEKEKDSDLMGLNAVPQQVKNYQRKYGFTPYHPISRWTGTLKPISKEANQTTIKILTTKKLGINPLLEYDYKLFLFDREKFLVQFLDIPKNQIHLAFDGKVRGYAGISPCVFGWKIGPFFSDHPKIAKALLNSFSHTHQGKVIHLDIPEPNRAGIDLAQQLSLCKIFDTIRMFKGNSQFIEPFQKQITRVYSVASLETG